MDFASHARQQWHEGLEEDESHTQSSLCLKKFSTHVLHAVDPAGEL